MSEDQTPQAPNPEKKEPKKFKTQIIEAPEKRTTKTDKTWVLIKSKGFDKNNKPRENKTDVSLFDESADNFLTAFEECALNCGDDPENYRPIVEFSGYWRKNTWTDRNGQTHEDWNFTAQNFSFDSV